MTVTINDLCVEILLQIFKYCDIRVLCQLRQSCKRFNKIINNHKIIKEEQNTLVTNQIKCSSRNRSLKLLNCFEKWRIYHNWKNGRYKATKLLQQKKKFMPWLQLEQKYLWLSQGKYLKAFSRHHSHIINENYPKFILSGDSNEDIVRFKIKDNFVISGLRNGGIWIWSLTENKFIVNDSNFGVFDVSDVDLTKEIYVSSSEDFYSIHSLNSDNNTRLLHTQVIHDKIWTVNISPCNKLLGVGSAGRTGLNSEPTFHIYDLERTIPLYQFQTNTRPCNGAGILDIHWENDTTAITCGYDGLLRKWDLRSGFCENIWADPYDAVVYCLASDDLYTLFTGTNTYGRVVLWDQRVVNKYVQMYFTGESSLYKSSPVYGIGFDSCQLFTALDRNTVCLDFSTYHGQIKDYNYDLFFYKGHY